MGWKRGSLSQKPGSGATPRAWKSWGISGVTWRKQRRTCLQSSRMFPLRLLPSARLRCLPISRRSKWATPIVQSLRNLHGLLLKARILENTNPRSPTPTPSHRSTQPTQPALYPQHTSPHPPCPPHLPCPPHPTPTHPHTPHPTPHPTPPPEHSSPPHSTPIPFRPNSPHPASVNRRRESQPAVG